jgi:predicted nucleotidyltransferase component of viral defense system
MNLSRTYLEQCASQTGFLVATLEKVARLGELAGSIARHPLLGELLALKGGTALNLCFGSPKRLSVDLDYNYIGFSEKEAMIAQRPAVRTALLQLVNRLEYRIQESAESFSGEKFFLSYRSVAGTSDRIEIDVNFLWRVPFSGTLISNMWQPGELDQPSIRLVGLPEIATGKLLALLDRAAVRDVWDVVNFPPAALAVVTSEEFRRLFIAFSVVLPHPLPTYSLERMQRHVTPRSIADHLLPTLVANADVKAENLVPAAWAVLDPIMSTRPPEREYLAGIKDGLARTELLFPEDAHRAREIATHPAIEWKLKNVRDHRRRPDVGLPTE